MERLNIPNFFLRFREMVGEIADLKTVYIVYNSLLSNAFRNHAKILKGKMRAFLVDDRWKFAVDGQIRQIYIDTLQKYISSFPWNAVGAHTVIPMLQGTSESGAWSICEHGFANLAANDEGYFGRGIYFTRDVDYAKQFAKPVNGIRTYLVCLVLPGLSYPVTEVPFFGDAKRPNPKGFYGKGVFAGYHSHYTIVPKGMLGAFPARDPYSPNEHSDELVIFQHAQALPLFLFTTQGQASS